MIFIQGHAPESSEHDVETGTTRTVMDPELCAGCTMQADCPIKQTRNGVHLDHTDKERRLDEWRREEKTEEFRECYKKRSRLVVVGEANAFCSPPWRG